MSLLHRSLLAAAASQALKKLEPFLVDALEGAVAIIAPPAAPIVNAVVGAADALIRSNNPDIPPAAVPEPALGATNANTAALAALQALGLQLSNIATQVAAMQAQLNPQ